MKEKLAQLLQSENPAVVKLGIEMMRDLDLGEAYELIVHGRIIFHPFLQSPTRIRNRVIFSLLTLLYGLPNADTEWSLFFWSTHIRPNYKKVMIARAAIQELWTSSWLQRETGSTNATIYNYLKSILPLEES